MNNSLVKLGIAPIAWTNDDLPELGGDISFERCICEMSKSGFAGCEVGNKYPKDPEILKGYLEPLKLQICNAWYSTFFTTKPEEETVEGFIRHRDFLYSMGAKVIGCSEQGGSIQGQAIPVFGNKPIFNAEEWKRLAAGMNLLAKLAGEKGMKVCLHHHMGTGIQTPAEIDRFMEMTNDDVYLLFDSGHIYYSEGTQESVDALLEKYISRVAHVHLKDIRRDVLEKVKTGAHSFLEGVKMGVFTVPGDGCISFDRIFSMLESHGYAGWMVVEAEQDPYRANPYAYAVKARDFIREKTGL